MWNGRDEGSWNFLKMYFDFFQVEQIPNKDAVEADLASLKAIHMVFANAKKNHIDVLYDNR